MKKTRLFFSGCILAILCGISFIACQDTEVAPEETVLASERIAGDEVSTDVDADGDDRGADLVAVDMTDELLALYEAGDVDGMQEYLNDLDLEATSDDPAPTPEQLYCNYKVKKVVAPDNPITGFPSKGWIFCVVCPPFCTPQIMLVSRKPVTPDGKRYIAYAELNQNGEGCLRCKNQNPNGVVPRG